MNDALKTNLSKLFQVIITILIILIVVDIIMLLALTFFSLKSSTTQLILRFDLLVSALTFLVFLISLNNFADKKAFLKENWILILTSFPVLFILWAFQGLYIVVYVLPVFNIVKIYSMLTGVGFASYATASVASVIFHQLRKERDKEAEQLKNLTTKFRGERKADDEEIKELLRDILQRMDEKEKK